MQDQSYKDIEHIIIDGGSTDGTIEIIRSSIHERVKFISESDNGLYDAINKGIKMATGEVVGLLHSDDIFENSEVISSVAEVLSNDDVDSIYADLVYVKREKVQKVLRTWKSGEFSRKKFNVGWMPPHPTFYVRKVIYDKYGLYDTDFKSAADYELMLRFLCKHEISTKYIPKTLIRMRVGGESNRSLSNRIRANKEDYKAWQKNNLSPNRYIRFLKPLTKVPQFLNLSRVF